MAGSAKPHSDHGEIRSHSSMLSNERIGYLLFRLDVASTNANKAYDLVSAEEMKSLLHQIWKNIRTLVRNNYSLRKNLNLETKEDGVYTIDAILADLDKKFMWCKYNDVTIQHTYILIKIMNGVELTLRDILQYFQYTFRHEFKQMPDVMKASEEFKQFADKLTIDQLKEVVGPKNQVDFDNLGADLMMIDDENRKP